jgi:RimJ/RimL family protein N-acetyltransferase
MISLRPSTREELEVFDAMDRQAHARNFVIQTGMTTHLENFGNPDITYLSIENGDGEFCGYFILVLEAESGSIEFRRILVDRRKRGVGQAAITEMERYCKTVIGVDRIWLDVFEDNEIGIHVYEKLGYRRFSEKPLAGRILYFYEKAL